MEEVSNVRLVRCPRCGQLSPESADFLVYRCGGGGTILQGKSQSEPYSVDTNIGGEFRWETERETIWEIQSAASPPDSLFVDASDVYLSFMGADTRSIFVDFLYQGLVNAGIRVFPPGEGFGQQIPRAIDRAKICIPIFSKNYASSKSCLRELAAMVESKAKSGGGKTIIPIFYDVEPRDVRLLTSLYRDALSIHKENLGSDRVEAWEYALAEVASLRGWVKGSGRPSHTVREVTGIVVKLKRDWDDITMKKGKDSIDATAKGGDTALGTDYADVYLSFRGADTCSVFVDFLCHSLSDAGICFFKVNEELPPGGEIGQVLLKAINRAKIYIPIFSRSYAYSVWCLQELAAMVENSEKSDDVKTIIPIFYDVETRDVFLRTSQYGKALLQHSERYEFEEVRLWRHALAKVAMLDGWDTRSSSPSHIVREVTGIVVKLKVNHVQEFQKKDEAKEGIDKQVEDMMDLLDLEVSDV